MEIDLEKLVQKELEKAFLCRHDYVDSIVIALDFGTTYSGVAYAFASRPETIHVITDWPKGKGFEKCPTLIKYGPSDHLSWGFELEQSSGARIEGIKLLLDPSQPKPMYFPALNAELELERSGRSAISVATDYITAIMKHSWQIIETKYPKGFLDSVEKQYVLSVPAVWSDKAQDATCRAARNSGIPNVKLIKEPEAAALWTSYAMKDHGLEVGDAIVICDAGGGTVDLISYEVESLHPLNLKELTKASGGLAGSLMINRRFEDRIKDIVGESAYLKLREKPVYGRGMKTFENIIKPKFKGEFDEDEFVYFPKARLKKDPAKGLEDDTFTVTGKILYEIFAPLVIDINRLVDEQVSQVRLKRMRAKHPKGDAVKAIFLVGGFGSNDFLYESIRSAHEPDIQVIRPDHAWSAVVRGAVISQLPTEARVTTNVAVKHYGVTADSQYREGIDPAKEKSYDYLEDQWRVQRMTWYISKGEDLKRSRKIEFHFYRAYSHEPSNNDLIFEDKLLECNLKSAPVYPNIGTITTNCTLRADLRKLPRHLIVKKTRRDDQGNMIPRWEVSYKLLVTIQSGPMRFSLMADGVEYGNVEAKY